MSAPAAIYGLEVPCGGLVIPADAEFPATVQFRITMAAIDPSAEAEEDEQGNKVPRATLKIIRQPNDMDEDDEDDEDDSEDEEYLKALLAAGSDDDESSEDDEDVNGGPSDPSKSEKARKEKAVAELKKALEEEDDMEIDTSINGINGTKKNKGKAIATGDEESSDEDEEDDEDLEIEEFVLCTLDPTKNYQQPLDITINEHEQVYFKVAGSYSVFLTGNYILPDPSSRGGLYDSDDDDEADYDLSPDEDELDDYDDEDESDELDDLEDPRIEELVSDDEPEPPKVVKESKKGKNKRAAEEDAEPTSLDDIMAKSLKPAADASAANGEPKLSKKQLKKLKNNAGKAVSAADAIKEESKATSNDSASPKDKKVQFAKELEQGPSNQSPAAKDSKSAKGDANKSASQSTKVIQGVTVYEKTVGKGPVAKKGNKVEMRYIGKLQSNGQQFDANKGGPPFGFKLGSGEVIKGWDIGIAGMAVGGERRLTVPPHLAYGSKKTGAIPANSTLVFDVKLMRIIGR